MAPLAVGICLEFYLVSRLVLHHHAVAFWLEVALFAIFLALWFVLPRLNQGDDTG